MPTIDVAIPSYQYAPYLRYSATSVLSQDASGLRLLIVDNASTDGSQEIAREIAADDCRVTLYLNDENRGMLDSYNRAIDWAAADYLVILDADDALAAHSLRYAVDFLERHPDVAFLYGVEGRLMEGRLDPGRCNSRRERIRVMSGHRFITQTCRDSFCDIGAPALVVRSETIKKAGYLNDDLVRTNDFEMYLRLAMLGDVAVTNRVLGVRRIHPLQHSAPYDDQRVLDFIEHERAFEAFFDRVGDELAEAAALQARARAGLGAYAWWYGLWQLLHRRPDAAAAFEFADAHREVPKYLPPLRFVLKRRWLRSVYRGLLRAVHVAPEWDSTYEVPRYW